MAVFAPVQKIDGYLPIEDHGLIGDGTTAALVGRDGAISWMCVPRFDSAPLFCRILDVKRGGAFTVAPEGLRESRRFYEGDTGVLVTEMRCPSGVIRLTDALSLHSGADLSEDVPAGRSELLRSVRVLEGRARVRIEIEPRGGVNIEAHGEGLRLRCPSHPHVELHFHAKGPRPVRSLKNRVARRFFPRNL
ncbi:MAG TPA: trehalase-like domain-containing protein [Candidatus Udaeobacter sp.]|nr:trehalase-like domain-containing protein [Candidatus Udaeobacter sp.]